jgi:hypothetical protein
MQFFCFLTSAEVRDLYIIKYLLLFILFVEEIPDSNKRSNGLGGTEPEDPQPILLERSFPSQVFVHFMTKTTIVNSPVIILSVSL